MNGKDDPTARGRAVPQAILINREVRRLVDPINEKVGDWQSDSVRLHAAAERMRQSGKHDPELVSSVTELLAAIEEHVRQFEEQVATASSELVAHSRISDTRKSLAMIEERLRRCLP